MYLVEPETLHTYSQSCHSSNSSFSHNLLFFHFHSTRLTGARTSHSLSALSNPPRHEASPTPSHAAAESPEKSAATSIDTHDAAGLLFDTTAAVGQHRPLPGSRGGGDCPPPPRPPRSSSCSPIRRPTRLGAAVECRSSSSMHTSLSFSREAAMRQLARSAPRVSSLEARARA